MSVIFEGLFEWFVRQLRLLVVDLRVFVGGHWRGMLCLFVVGWVIGKVL